MRRRRSSIHRRKSLCSKQQDNQERNFKEKSQLSRCRTSRTITDAETTQEKLLVARTQ